MAHCDTYREQLAITYPLFGYALWEPTFVDLGDVGYIRQGKFHRLFNALLSADHPSHHGIPLPEHHEPLIPNVPDHIDRGTLKPDHYCSIGVTVEPESEDVRATGPSDFPHVSFFCTRARGGAVLSLPVDVQRLDTRARGNFGSWMIKHIDSWFTFTRRLGLGIEHMEEIVLVTGLHLTRSWANVAFFEGQANGQASLGVNVIHSPDMSIHWQCSPGSVRGGVRSWGPEGKNLPENQCVFIRGFRVARVLGILRRRLRGAAGANPMLDLEPGDDEPDKGLTSISAAETNCDLQMLFENIAEQAPDHDMVLIHDDDLARIGNFHHDKEVLQRDALVAHLRTSLIEIQQILCDFPTNTGDDLTTGTENTKVAMFAKEFQKWCPAPPQPSTVITSQNIDSSHLSVSSVSALQTSPGAPSTERRHDSGGSIGFSPCRPLQEDQNITSHLVSDSLHGRPPSPILTLPYDDTHQTVPCHIVPGLGYDSNYNLFGRLLTPSHVIPWDENRSIPRRHLIIDDLEIQAEGIPSAGPYNRNSHPMSFDPEYKYGAREYQVPIGTHSPIEGSCPPKGSTVRLARVASIGPRVLQWVVVNEQNHDNVVLAAKMVSNNVVHITPHFGYPSNELSLSVDLGKRPIGAGIFLWRGYFQSLRPTIGRMLTNVDISTGAMYRPGKLIDLALEFLGKPGTLDALAPRYGLSDHERLRLQQFISGIKITTPHRTLDPDRRRLVKKLTRESARDRTFQIRDGETTTVAEYFQDLLDISLRFPDLICVELSTGAIIPFELCEVPPGQLVIQQFSLDKISSILESSIMHPRKRKRTKSIHRNSSVLQNGQSEYVCQFSRTVEYLEGVVATDDQIIKAPAPKYPLASEQTDVRWNKDTWKLFDKLTYKAAKVPNWVLLIYENQQRFNQRVASQMIVNLVKGCEAVGINIKSQPALVRWESGQGNIGRQLCSASKECQWISKAPPTLIVVILPEGGSDIYTTIKHFGDVSAGIATQCMKSAKCCRASAQYYTNIAIKINVKLGSRTNVVPELQDISFLNDTANPTIVMAADIIHPPPGSRGRPSTTCLVGGIDSSGAKYVSRIGTQTHPQGLIQDMKDMCVHVFEQFRAAMSRLPKRILFYRNGASKREFKSIMEEELPLIRDACAKLGFNPTITLIIVGKEHKIILSTSEVNADRENYPVNTVKDMALRGVSPVEFDYYLFGTVGPLGTSKATYYNVLVDENKFTSDVLQSLSSALCDVYASSPSVSIPAPVYYARARARNAYDKQEGHDYLNPTPMQTAYLAEDEDSMSGDGEFRRGFQPTHERENLGKVMYFC